MNIKWLLINLGVISMMTTSWAANEEINHLQLNSSHLIETGQAQYAIRAPILEQNDWKTFSINGNEVLIVSAQCKQTKRTKESLSQRELDLLMEARRQLYQMNENKGPATRYCWAVWSLASESFSLKYAKRVDFSMFSHNGSSVTLYDKENFSASRLDLPKRLVRVFVAEQVATFVYGDDGRVQMKPIKCLQKWEAHLIEQLKRDAHSAGQIQECPANDKNSNKWTPQEANQLELKLREQQQQLKQQHQQQQLQLEQQKQLQQLHQMQEQLLIQQQQEQQHDLQAQLQQELIQQQRARQQQQQEERQLQQHLQELLLKQQQQQIQLQRQQLQQQQQQQLQQQQQQSSLNWPKTLY